MRIIVGLCCELRQSLLFTDVQKYTERYLKQNQVEDEEWTPGTHITHCTGINVNQEETENNIFFVF